MEAPLILRRSKPHALVLLVLSIAALALTVSYFQTSDKSAVGLIIGGLLLVSLGRFAFSRVRDLLDNAVHLSITSEGIAAPSLSELLKWEHIDEVDLHEPGMRSYLEVKLVGEEGTSRGVVRLDCTRLTVTPKEIHRQVTSYLDDLRSPYFDPLTDDHDYDGFNSHQPDAKELSDFFPLTEEEFDMCLATILKSFRTHRLGAHEIEVGSILENSDTSFEALTLVTEYLLTRLSPSERSLIKDQIAVLQNALQETGWKFH